MFVNKGIYRGGQAVILLVLLLFVVAMIVFARLGDGGIRGDKIARIDHVSKAVATIADSALEDMIERIRLGDMYDEQEIYNIGGGVASVNVEERLDLGLITLTANASIDGVVRKKEAVLARGFEAYFKSALVGGTGSVVILDTSKVVGDIISYSSILGSGNHVTGDVSSIGESGSIQGLDIVGDARASSILSSIISGDAYYSINLLASVVGGRDVPSDAIVLESSKESVLEKEVIEDLKLGAGVNTYPMNICPVIIGGGENIVLGPTVIGCDLIIEDNANVAIKGPVWVKGNVMVKDDVHVSIHDDLSCRSVAIIADNPINRLSSSRVSLSGNAVFTGSSGPSCLGKSFIALVSTNKILNLNVLGQGANTYIPSLGAEGNISGDLILYSSEGLIKLDDNVNVTAVSGSGVIMEGNSQISYQDDSSKIIISGSDKARWQVISFREVE